MLLDDDSVADALPGSQGRLLLAFLVFNLVRNLRGTVGRDELIDAIWPRVLPREPRAALRTLLSRTRQALPGLIAGGREVQLALPDGSWIDVQEGLLAARRAALAMSSDEWRAAHTEAQTAVELIEAPLMPGHRAPWLEEWRRELAEVQADALEIQARTGIMLGGAELAESHRLAKRLAAAEPDSESAHALLMESHAARGNPAEAIRVYDRLRRRLADGLGVAPSAELQRLHLHLLAGTRTRN